MLKPLSPKTLEKKYAELGLSQAKLELLHSYYRCFANLYGVISLREAWQVFKHYEGSTLRKKDFVAFSGVVQRESGLPYTVFDIKEIYSGEETDDPLERMIVNNKLVFFGRTRFSYVYETVEKQGRKPLYLPEKEEFLLYTEDRFYQTAVGLSMKAFVENLRCTVDIRDYHSKSMGPVTDIHGISARGKKLSEIVFLTFDEQLDLDYYNSKALKEKILAEAMLPASEKILKRIEEDLMIGGLYKEATPLDQAETLCKLLCERYGVALSEKQEERFLELFVMLNNNSHLWLNCGWTPAEFARRFYGDGPKSIKVGANMKKLLDSGELDREELRRQLAEKGFELIEE